MTKGFVRARLTWRHGIDSSDDDDAIYYLCYACLFNGSSASDGFSCALKINSADKATALPTTIAARVLIDMQMRAGFSDVVGNLPIAQQEVGRVNVAVKQNIRTFRFLIWFQRAR